MQFTKYRQVSPNGIVNLVRYCLPLALNLFVLNTYKSRAALVRGALQSGARTARHRNPKAFKKLEIIHAHQQRRLCALAVGDRVRRFRAESLVVDAADWKISARGKSCEGHYAIIGGAFAAAAGHSPKFAGRKVRYRSCRLVEFDIAVRLTAQMLGLRW